MKKLHLYTLTLHQNKKITKFVKQITQHQKFTNYKYLQKTN